MLINQVKKMPETTAAQHYSKKALLKPLVMGAVLLVSSTTLLAENSNSTLFDESAMEKSRHKSEATGLVGGAVIGGIIAGPPGAIIAGVIGAIAGNHHSTKEENQQLQASLVQSQNELYALQEQKNALDERYQLSMEEKQNSSFMNVNLASVSTVKGKVCCADSEFAMHFKSNSTDIENHYQNQLKELARISTTLPDPIIEITGFADRRGSSKNNLALSQNRIKAVEDALLGLGVNSNIIQSNAFGEDKPLNSIESQEGNFFDRRVNIKIRSANNDFLTLGK